MDSRRNSETSELLNERYRAPQAKQRWDSFREDPVKVHSRSMQKDVWIDRGEKIGKIFAYIVTFIVILGSATISKGTLLFITSQLSNETRRYCGTNLDDETEFRVWLPRVERVLWIWILIFIYWIPELGTFLRSVRICLFKNFTYPTYLEFFSIFVTESLPAIGSAIFVFVVLPEIDVVRGVMLTNGVCLIPALMSAITRDFKRLKSSARMVCDILSLIAQISALFVWPILENKTSLYFLIISLLFISVGWWENFASDASPLKLFKLLAKKKVFENKRYFIYAFVSIWKAFLFFLTTIVIIAVKDGEVAYLFDEFSAAFKSHGIIISGMKPEQIDPSAINIRTTVIDSDIMTAIWLFILNILSTYICYAFGKFACKIMIQDVSYAFPINLAVPFTVSMLIIMCNAYNKDICAYHNVIPSYLFFKSPPMYELTNYTSQVQPWIWLLWILSQTWISIHVWRPTCEKLARTETLFFKPMYDAFFIDQSLALNRRRVDDMEYKKIDDDTQEEDNVTRIYACATMWHENQDEMMEFLKSIMRLDNDHSARRKVKEYLVFDIPDYYKLETHIFFDDAFIRISENDPDPQLNDFVKCLVDTVDAAASDVHEKTVRLRPPKIYITPYGGRVIWTLPGKTKMIAHLKDKKKIRAKKRWSQCMYMYYLLGHKLIERDLPEDRLNIIAENTYILALDGDMDFQPDAVLRLVDLMKKNKGLGAACGRIHPIGSGPMAWYQMFEYAVGHWLQKATEHMIGCVLCSPGCFSLFRGKALMDDNVMKKYTTKSTEAMHYVQFDQGEDRWLCTLLLQRGYKVEYSAASDAYTHCPEGFNEFYNQRRRWMPSTTANIMDLLLDYKRVIKINDNISYLYILYQFIMMIGTVLGPGTIFLMLVGAFVSAFQMDQWTSFLWNAVPILIYMFISMCFKDTIQLFFAGLISGIYGLVMMAVLVGVMLQISQDGFLAPSSLFFFCVAGEMIITAMLHPKEFECLKYGIIYYVTVPSMYLLLVIYSIFNMNNVSWGTREVTIVKKSADNDHTKTEAQKEETLLDKIKSFGTNNNDNSGAFEFSLFSLFKCLLCTRKDNYEETMQLQLIGESLEKLSKKIETLEKLQLIDLKDPEAATKKLKIIHGDNADEIRNTQPISNIKSNNMPEIITTVDIEEQQESYSWTEDEVLQRGETLFLSKKEEKFWNGLQEAYLHPIDDTKDKARIAQNLKDLRDKAVFAFFMLNSLFVLIIFLLTLKKDLLHINWPLDVKYNVSYIKEEAEISIQKKYLELEPIGFVFLIFFGILLVVQFVAMLLHRFGTFCQILANTHVNISCFKKSLDNYTKNDLNVSDVLKLAFELQKLKGIDDDDMEEDSVSVPVTRRKTIHNIKASQEKRNQPIVDLDKAFKKRQNNIKNNPSDPRRKTVIEIDERRKSIHQTRLMLPLNGRPSGLIDIPNNIYGINNPTYEEDV